MTATKLNGTNFFGMGDKDQLSIDHKKKNKIK